jgi:hypothetical protein
MTVLINGKARASFDTVTLGIRAPRAFDPGELKDICTYVDDQSILAVCDVAAFVHEVSHYLQFYGTLFGFSYLHMVQQLSHCLGIAIESMSNKTGLCFPISSWRVNISELFKTNKERAFYTSAILRNRYYNEELYGLTYSHFGRNHPIQSDGRPILTSPLYLELDDGTVFPFTGETLLENYAACQEAQFLSTVSPRILANKVIENSYLSLPKRLQAHYMGISVWFGTFGLLELEPLLYFVLLNQPPEDFENQLGDYTLARNAKKLLMRSDRLKQLPRPNTDGETQEVLEKIVDTADLVNPLETLPKWRDLVVSQIEGTHYPDEDSSWVVDWISSRIWSWFIERPIRVLKWPYNFRSLFREVPILNIRFDNLKERVFNRFEDQLSRSHLALVNRHQDYCEHLHILFGLFSEPQVCCPLSWKGKPNICDSCAQCSGNLPDYNIGQDCPILIKYASLFRIGSKK